MAFGDYATLLDDFNRANDVDISGTNWTSKVLSTNDFINLNTNALAGNSSAVCSAWYNAASPAADCELYCTMSVKPGNGSLIGLYARLSSQGTASPNGYFCQVTPQAGSNNDQAAIFRLDAGLATSLGSDSSTEWSAGDKLGFELIGSSLKLYRNSGAGWTQLVSATDSTYSASGPIGVRITNTLARVDDVFVGDITSTVKPKTLMTLGIG